MLACSTRSDDVVLYTDASAETVGSVLSQRQGDREKVIVCASKTFSHTQTRYCTTYLELLAVVIFVKHFHHYLCGRPFTIITDHESLTRLPDFKEHEGKVAGWLGTLGMYDFQIVHRPGKSMGNAYILFRKVLQPSARVIRAVSNKSQQSISNHSDVVPIQRQSLVGGGC